jgi:hypothetical protein
MADQKSQTVPILIGVAIVAALMVAAALVL